MTAHPAGLASRYAIIHIRSNSTVFQHLFQVLKRYVKKKIIIELSFLAFGIHVSCMGDLPEKVRHPYLAEIVEVCTRGKVK